MTEVDREKQVMDFVNEQFKQVNKKLDKLTELTEQTHLQEYRLNQLEAQLKVMMQNRSEVLWRILTPVVATAISAITSFIIAGGLK